MATEVPDLAVALAVLRVARGWSQADVAEASGVRASSISDYEQGKKVPELRTLQKILLAMGYPLSAIDGAETFVSHLRQRKLDLEGETGERDSGPELGSRTSAAARWELEVACIDAGRAVTGLLRAALRSLGAGASPSEASGAESDVDMTEIYAILSRRYETGETDVAARHNELEP
jgi:transcriptional regulator with XRE-family HTH domain